MLYLVIIHPYFNPRERMFRWELMVAYYHVIMSPFQKVNFRHYMLAVVTSSLMRSMYDLGLIVIYFTYGYWVSRDPVIKKNHIGYAEYCLFMNLWPYWWRFWQCANKRYYTGSGFHTANCVKYCFKMYPVVIVWYNANKFMNL